MLKQYKQSGFTIVELLVVIVIIGILAALALNTFGSAPARARDTTRKTDINSVATQLEAYYVDNSNYPAGPGDLTVANLEGVSEEALTDEDGDTLQAAAVTNELEYRYQTLPAGCDNSATDCEQFTLTTFLEEDDSGSYVKDSLNKVPTP